MNDRKKEDFDCKTSVQIAKNCLKFFIVHWRWFIKEIIFAAVVLIWLVPAVEKGNHTEYQIRRDMDNFIEIIRTLGYQDEVTYTYCQLRKKNPISEKEFDQNLMLINNERTKAFLELVSVGKTLQKNHQLKGVGYDAIVSFGRWNNMLLDAGLDVCSQNLKGPAELRQWTDGIIKEIDKGH